MGRRCCVGGCGSAVGLHYLPQDSEIRRQWLCAIGIWEDSELPIRAGVCNQHFTLDCFDNLMEYELGYAAVLRLKSEAVPTLALPQPRQRTSSPTPLPLDVGESELQSETAQTREIGCQTDPVLSRHVCVQANLKRSKHSKATKERGPNQSGVCDTGTLMDIPLSDSPRANSTPLKRKRCESSASDNSLRLNDSAGSVNCTSTPTEAPPHKDKKYIVHEEQLLGLFRSCPVCTSCCTVDTVTDGTLLQVTQQCHRCEFYHQWSSQPVVNNIPAGNLQLCAAVLFTGSSFAQISKFLTAFNIQGLTEQSYYSHKHKLLIPTVNWQWKLEQDQLIREAIDGGPVTLGGDMQLDAPGHSAKYGSCTMMDLKNNKVVNIQLVQRSEVGSSVGMEKEGFVRSFNLLEERGVKVQAIVTGHAGVQKFLRKEKTDVIHYFDPRHMGKANYVSDVHTHDEPQLPCRLPEPKVGESSRQWLKPSKRRTAACKKLTATSMAPRFRKDVENVSPLYHTSALEAFHNLMIRFSPKSVGFSFKAMLARLQIAALHYNENAATAPGELRYAIVFPKYKCGDYTVRVQKPKPTSIYIDKLMGLLFENVVDDAHPYQEHSEKIPVPEPLCAQFERPNNLRL